MNSGVYLITAPSGKRYIGSAVNLSNRKAVHWHQLRRGKHPNRYLQRSWNRHGGQGFEFRTLLICAKENLLMYEQALIDGLSPEFNICKIAGNTVGVRRSRETRDKYAAAMRRRIAERPEVHAITTRKANARIRQLHSDPAWRRTWEEAVKTHGEKMAKPITWNGRTQSITKWAEELGVPRTTLKHRINKHGVEAAFCMPLVTKCSREAWLLRNENAGVSVYEMDGEKLTKTEFAARLGISRVTLRDWEKRGLTQEQMIARRKS